MVGTVVGSIDHRLGDGIIASDDLNQELFKIIYDFFETTTSATRIALQYGNGGTGTDFHDEASPFGNNAFAVFTMTNAGTPYDILIQWADTDNFGNSPGNPGLINGTTQDGVAIVIAFREDGTSPWAGTTNNDGTDSKAATVWSAGGSTLHLVDLANSTGGSFATNKENVYRIDDLGTNGSFNRVHMVADDDSFLILTDSTNNGFYRAFWAGRYDVRTGLSISYPFAMIAASTTGVWSGGTTIIHGTTLGTNAREGGIIGRDPSNGTQQLSLVTDWPQLLNSTYQPNSQAVTPELDSVAIALITRTANIGFAGSIDPDIVAVVYNVSNLQTNAAATRAYLGHTTVALAKYSIPWDGGAAPGTGTSRTGRQF